MKKRKGMLLLASNIIVVLVWPVVALLGHLFILPVDVSKAIKICKAIY